MIRSSFGRRGGPRHLLLRNLAASLIFYESVITTSERARAVQPIVERLISLGKKAESLAGHRRLLSYLPDPGAVRKIVDELVPRYATRSSGFTRRLHLPPRAGDGARQVVIQLIDTPRLNPKALSEQRARGGKKVKNEVAG